MRIPVGELVDYGSREQTRTDHLREVARYLGVATGRGVPVMSGAEINGGDSRN